MAEDAKSKWADPKTWASLLGVVVVVGGAIIAGAIERDRVLTTIGTNTSDIRDLKRADSLLVANIDGQGAKMDSLRRDMRPVLKFLKKFAVDNGYQILWPDE